VQPGVKGLAAQRTAPPVTAAPARPAAPQPLIPHGGAAAKPQIVKKKGEDGLEHIFLVTPQGLVELQEATGHLYNLEATPAEGATYRFAREDRRRFPDILQAGTPDHPYYTNSSQLPVGYTDDPFEALSRQDELQTKYTGGTVLHLYMAERLSSPDACRTLVRRALSSFRLPYLTVTPTFSICPSHGYLAGEHPTCPTCAEACEVWTRVMGYHRPVSSFNVGKQGEHVERVPFRERAAALV